MQIIKSSKKGGGWGGGVVNLVADIPAWRINESLYWYFWVVTIIIDEVTIALPLQSSLTTSVRSDGKKKKQPKSVLHIQSFCFAYVHVSVVTVVPLTLLVATQTLENMQQNRHPHIPTQRPIHELVSFHNYIIPDCISYQVICMWENKQRLGRQITSTAECGSSFQSLQIITCNIKYLQKLKCTDMSPTNTLYW